MLSFLLFAGCGDTPDNTGTTTTAPGKGTIYVAVTSGGEVQAGTGNSGIAIIDLDTKKVEMVNLPEPRSPYGIIFSPDTRTASNTDGRIALESPGTIYLGSAGNGSVNIVDLPNRKVIRTIDPPSGIGLRVWSMKKGPDGKIYMTSMGDGKLYALDDSTGTITETGVGGGDVTQSVYGIAWTKDGKFAYLGNLMNPGLSNQAGSVVKVEWPSGKLVKRIENVTMPAPRDTPIVNDVEMTPDGRFLYVTDGVQGALVKIDQETDTIVKTIPVGKEPRAIIFSADGTTGYITVMHEPVENESSVFVYDVVKDQVVDRIPNLAAPIASGLVWSP